MIPTRSQLLGYFLDQEKIRKNVIVSECLKDPALVSSRVKQLIQDFDQGISNADVKDGVSRREWKKEKLEVWVQKFTTRFSETETQNPKQDLAQGFLSFLRTYSLNGEAPARGKLGTPLEFQKWFYDRAQDPQPILYYYPGEKRPRVKVVSTFKSCLNSFCSMRILVLFCLKITL